MSTQLPDMWSDAFLAVREIPGLGLCAVQRFVFTCGLLVNVRISGLSYDYDARFCYSLSRDALRDLQDWDGKGDPPGDWIKEKVSGRGKPVRSNPLVTSTGLSLESVAPCGKQTAFTFHGEYLVDVYPHSPEGKALRDRRRELDLTLRDAAKLLGLMSVELSRLENGSAVTDWPLAMTKLNGGK